MKVDAIVVAQGLSEVAAEAVNKDGDSASTEATLLYCLVALVEILITETVRKGK